jgi:hypothetical protein
LNVGIERQLIQPQAIKQHHEIEDRPPRTALNADARRLPKTFGQDEQDLQDAGRALDRINRMNKIRSASFCDSVKMAPASMAAVWNTNRR